MDTIWTPESITFYFLTLMDPLRCPAWSGQVRIFCFIEETKTIDRIFAHLKLTFEAERPLPPYQQELRMAAEEEREYYDHADEFFPLLFTPLFYILRAVLRQGGA